MAQNPLRKGLRFIAFDVRCAGRGGRERGRVVAYNSDEWEEAVVGLG